MARFDDFSGRVLQRKERKDGYPELVIDNGPDKVINITCPDDVIDTITDKDVKDIHEHLMTRKQGRFRVKKGNT
jgi:hypothetical protein